MSFSLYGALPPSKSSKESDNRSKTNSPASKPSSLYSSLPAPEIGSTNFQKNETTQPTTVTENATPSADPSVTTTPAPTNDASTPSTTTGWSAINKFRPVIRRPTIQAKPRLNKPFIPAGATIVSTKTITKEEQKIEEEKQIDKSAAEASQQEKASSPAVQVDLGAIPLFTSAEDVNGFRNTAQYNKKKKKKGKAVDTTGQHEQPQPVVFDMMEDYDPHKPNDYEQYKEERKELREKQKRKREWEKKQQEQQLQQQQQGYSRQSRSWSRSRSYSSSRSRSRSRSYSPYSRSRSRSRSPEPMQQSPRLSTAQSHTVEPPAIKINVNETADDAYMRRAMLSQQQTTSRVDPLKSAQDMARQVADKFAVKKPEQEQPPTTVQHNLVEQAPTHVVLLTNMVGPGEVDDLLQQETAEECSKYGKVERCLIFEVPRGQIPDDRAVRIFVRFAGIESARQAVNDLNGRFFGGRVVSASFFDTVRFEKLDLAPTREELYQ